MIKNPVMDEVEEGSEKDSPEHEIAEIRDLYGKTADYWSDDREAARDDIKFRAGEQWPETVKAQRERDKRPCLTVDKLNQYVRQIVNDGRQNRPSIKVRPVDSSADVATAEVFQGIVKHIEDRSGADAAYDTALDGAATCGFGYFRVLTEYVGDESFDQEIVIRRIRNSLSVMIDPDSQEADGSDMKYAFVIEEMSKDDFKEKYPGKYPTDFASDKDYGDWFGDHVRIVEYWRVEEEERELVQLADGKILSRDSLDELKATIPDIENEIIETRMVPKRTVKYCKVSGNDFLEEEKDWPGKYIPIMTVWGNEIDIEGKVTHSGIIRPGKDPQRLYNYSRSAFAERVALTPKAPWVAAEGQVENYEDEWATANTDNHSVLRYTPTSLNGTPVPPPQRINASDVPAGFAQDMQISEHDIQGAIGMYAASLGAPSNERSGKAIMARQREGDVGTFHYHDNLNRAIRYCGTVLIDLIPKIYNSSRVIRILGYDGTPGEASIDPNTASASQKMGVGMVYNLGVGTYDVSLDTGPSYTTMRQESAAAMTEMVQANPALMQIAGDLIVKAMDWPGAQELADRLKLTLPPEIQQAERDRKSGTVSPEIAQMQNEVKIAMEQKDQLMEQAVAKIEELTAEVQKLQSDYEVKMAEVAVKQQDSAIKAQELQISQFEAETARMIAEANAQNAQATTEIAAFTAANPPQAEQSQPVAPAEPALDIGQILQAVTSMQQPINITVPVTVDGKGQTVKQGKAVRQADGSYIMESVETPITQ